MMKRGVILLYRDFSMDWLPVLLDSGINTLGLHTLDMYGGVEGYLEWLKTPKVRAELDAFERAGITVEHELHAAGYLVPRSELAAHPEWCRMDETGVRNPQYNFCSSAEPALELAQERAYELARVFRQHSHRYFLWQDDTDNISCRCERCAAFSPADQNMLVMNRIIQGLRRYDPRAQLSYLAYQDTMSLPTVPPDPGLFLEFAPINRDHRRPMNCDEPQNAGSCETLRRLLKIFPAATAQILEYFLDVSYFCGWKRDLAGALELDEGRLRQDVAFYSAMGVGGITTFCAFMDENWRARYGTEDVRRYGEALRLASKEI